MNRLTTEKRAQILGMMVEGISVRAISRMTGASKNTIVKLLADAGKRFSDYHDEKMRDLSCNRLQLDEIRSFVYAKAKNVACAVAAPEIAGDIWTWTAIDVDTKLIASWLVGDRSGETACRFVRDLAGRLKHRVQITTDGHKAYLQAVEEAFGSDVDYAMLEKIYTPPPQVGPVRYRPGVSKKIENHVSAISIYFMHYNFCRIHQTLRVTPAMETGIADHVWSLEELAGLIDSN